MRKEAPNKNYHLTFHFQEIPAAQQASQGAKMQATAASLQRLEGQLAERLASHGAQLGAQQRRARRHPAEGASSLTN